MAAAPLVVVAAAAAASAYGGIKAASDRAEAEAQAAILKNQQADELLAREQINEGIMQRQGAYEQLQLGAKFSGFEGGNVGEMVTAQNNLNESIRNSRRDAEFKARMLRAGANIDTQLASDLKAASYIGATGTVLGAAANIYGSAHDFGSTSKLPSAPTTATSMNFGTGWWR